MLMAVPKKWFSWDFHIRDDHDKPVGEVRLSAWRERGAIIAGGFENRVRRESALGAFIRSSQLWAYLGAERPRKLYRKFIPSLSNRNNFRLCCSLRSRRESREKDIGCREL
jgi:hypothetical protein